jgi:hypothetical protein
VMSEGTLMGTVDITWIRTREGVMSRLSSPGQFTGSSRLSGMGSERRCEELAGHPSPPHPACLFSLFLAKL